MIDIRRDIKHENVINTGKRNVKRDVNNTWPDLLVNLSPDRVQERLSFIIKRARNKT